MNLINTYIKLGINHITDVQAFDHILFVLLLVVSVNLINWKRTLILITAFTIGHSLSLALASLGIIKVSTSYIEFLIPLTILFTATYNIINRKQSRRKMTLVYSITLVFGLIHGLGFSNYLQTLLYRQNDILIPLLGFNIGVEIGQLTIVITYYALIYVLQLIVKLQQSKIATAVSLLGIIISFILCIQRFPI